MKRKSVVVFLAVLAVGLLLPAMASAQSWVRVGDITVYEKGSCFANVSVRAPVSTWECDSDPLEVVVTGVPYDREYSMYVIDGDRVIWSSQGVKNGVYKIIPYHPAINQSKWLVGRHNIRVILSSHPRFDRRSAFDLRDARYLHPRTCCEIVRVASVSFTIEGCRPAPAPPPPPPCHRPPPTTCCPSRPSCGLPCVGLVFLLLLLGACY